MREQIDQLKEDFNRLDEAMSKVFAREAQPLTVQYCRSKEDCPLVKGLVDIIRDMQSSIQALQDRMEQIERNKLDKYNKKTILC